MNDSTANGCGCLLVSMVIALVLGLAYPVFDGYIDRKIPSEQKAAIEVSAPFVVKSDGSWTLFVALNNKSNWVMSRATGQIRFDTNTIIRKASDDMLPTQSKLFTRVFVDLSLWYETGPLTRSGSTIAELHKKDGTVYFQMPLTIYASDFMNKLEARGINPRYAAENTWHFTLLKVEGHRPPIRLVKAPIDWIKNLFERP